MGGGGQFQDRRGQNKEAPTRASQTAPEQTNEQINSRKKKGRWAARVHTSTLKTPSTRLRMTLVAGVIPFPPEFTTTSPLDHACSSASSASSSGGRIWTAATNQQTHARRNVGAGEHQLLSKTTHGRRTVSRLDVGRHVTCKTMIAALKYSQHISSAH